MALPLRVVLAKTSPALIVRSFHPSSVKEASEKKMNALQFKLAGFYKYGLLKDDLLSEWHPEVQEAVRRLPEELQMQRMYRAIRAHQAEINHSVLPPEQWSKLEDDHYYLEPYLDEVVKEIQEREEWNANY